MYRAIAVFLGFVFVGLAIRAGVSGNVEAAVAWLAAALGAGPLGYLCAAQARVLEANVEVMEDARHFIGRTFN